MTDIQRFEAHETGMLFADGGEWVRHADHEAAIAAERARADALVAAAYEDAARRLKDAANDEADTGSIFNAAIFDTASNLVSKRTPADARAALDRLVEEAERRGAECAGRWQPIETAPKDAAILAFEDGVMRVVFWDGNDWHQPAIPVFVNAWGERLVSREVADVFPGHRLELSDCLYSPTHWMPLPAPPKGDDQ